MKQVSFSVIISLIALLPLSAEAASVTYDFTGTVTEVGGRTFAGISTGMEITGAFTIDFGNSIAAQSCGAIGAYTATCGQIGYNWNQAEETGPGTGYSLSNQYVFSISAAVGNIQIPFSPGVVSQSQVAGANGYNGTTGWYAQNAQYNGSGPGSAYSSFASINLGDGPSTWGPDGLPSLFSTGTAKDVGEFLATPDGAYPNSDSLVYSINSITPANPVPLPAAAWLMLSGLGGLAAMTRRREIA